MQEQNGLLLITVFISKILDEVRYNLIWYLLVDIGPISDIDSL